MTCRGVAPAMLLAASVVFFGAAPVSAGDGEVAAGFLEGREHEVRVRPVLGELPPEAVKLSATARRRGARAVVACDPSAVRALGRKVPTSLRDDDDPAACVLLEQSSASAPRLLLGPAHLGGSELGRISLHRGRKGNERVVVKLSPRGQSMWAFIGPEVGDTLLAVSLDGTVLDLVPITDRDPSGPGGLSFTIGGKRGVPTDVAEDVQGRLDQAELEDVIELARVASLSRAGRDVYAHAHPVISEKADFIHDCQLPEAANTFVLGCFDGFSNVISILRVDRADIADVMPVTAAHEMLHAVYQDLGGQARRKVDRMIESFLAAVPQPKIEEELALYTKRERANEAHSIVGTEVRDLPRGLEQYYRLFFKDRSAVVDLFESYEMVFDALEERFVTLEYELAAIEAQLHDLQAQADAAGREADGLSNRINDLRNQGRIDESNGLVGAQNAAADRANSLAAQYNALADTYNAKLAELNAAGESLGELYNAVAPLQEIPIQ